MNLDTVVDVQYSPEENANEEVEAPKTDTINLSDLSDGEIEYICRRIPAKETRTYFQQFPKHFAKIRPGFRPSKLSEKDITGLLCKNITKPFISEFVKIQVDAWLSEIRAFRDELEEKGASADESLLRAIPNCVFSENIDLYFKLCNIAYPPEYISLLKNVLPLMKDVSINDDSFGERSAKPESEQSESGATEQSDRITALTETVSQLQNDLKTEKANHKKAEKALTEATGAQDKLQHEITELKASLASKVSKEEQMQAELERLHRLESSADIDSSDNDDNGYEYTSICRVFTDYSGNSWLSRLADVSNGQVSRFIKNDEEPNYFGNRDRLYWKNGPSDEGYVGIWSWNAVSNLNDPAKDYVTTEYNAKAKWIEVIELPDCHSSEDLANYLTSNSVRPFFGRKMLFVYRAENGMMSGLLCGEKDFEIVNGNARLKKSIYSLPQYSIAVSDVLKFDEVKIYRFTKLGLPQSVFRTKTPMAVVKEVVLSRATGSVLRGNGLSKKEAQHCRTFLDKLPTNTVYQEIADTYGCAEEEARQFVTEFIEQADQYLSATDLDVAVISEALGRNSELVSLCKNSLAEEWHEENEETLRRADARLEEIRADIERKKKISEALTADHSRLRIELTQIQEEIDSKKALAEEAERKVSERISSAKKNVADFICEMAFATGYLSSQSMNIGNSDSKIRITRRTIDTTTGEMIHDLESFEEELAENLEIAGYETSISVEMANGISFCICNDLPIIINENAEIIADCIAAMFSPNGAYAATLPIGEGTCTALCDSIENSAVEPHSVYVLHGIFDGFSLNPFNELLWNLNGWNRRIIPVLSISGISVEMLPASVWNRALYIDGDIGLKGFITKKLNSFCCDFEFMNDFDMDSMKEKRKTMKPFREIISNTALLNYAKFMAAYDVSVQTSLLLRLQLAVAAKSSGLSDSLAKAFADSGVDAESTKRIKKYL